MIALPKKTAEAETGSNIPKNPILNHRKQLFATHNLACTGAAPSTHAAAWCAAFIECLSLLSERS